MSTVLVAVIIIAGIASICLLVVALHNQQERKCRNELLHHFHEWGLKHNLLFSGQEMLQDCIVGVDGLNRKLLVVSRVSADYFSATIVHLDEVKSCCIKKYFAAMSSGNTNSRRADLVLEKLVLRFEFINIQPATEIIFYQHIEHSIYKLPELEQKAKDWEVILSKMLNAPSRIA